MSKVAIRVEFEPGDGGRALILCRDQVLEYCLTDPWNLPCGAFVASLNLEFDARDFRVNWMGRIIEVLDADGMWHLWVCVPKTQHNEWLMSAQKFKVDI